VTLLHARAGRQTPLTGWEQLASWRRWDTIHFLRIAEHGYTTVHQEDTAFFPLFPMLVRGVGEVTGPNLLIAGLVVSNVACFFALAVLHRLAAHELDSAAADRAVYYLVAFPTAYFLAASYSHSLLLLCVLGCLYAMRRGHWWLAGAVGALASATRSTGLLLMIPFAYEYLRQHRWYRVRPDALAIALVPVGTVAYCWFTWWRFGDFLAFSTAQEYWRRTLDWPGHTLWLGIRAMARLPVLVDYELILDVSLTVMVLALLVLCVVGPWRLRGDQVYLLLYGVPAALLPLFFPRADNNPMLSMSRLLLDVVPVFLVLARMGANRWFDRVLPYPLIALQCGLLVLFLANAWTF
jgi:hypothetical protein